MPLSTGTTGTMVPSHSNVESRATSPALVSTIKILLVLIAQLPLIHASPLRFRARAAEEEPMPAHEPTLWIYLAVAIALVLLGGAFAGLTIALMGQDEIYLQVIKTSGEGSEKKHAAKVLRLLNRGKHWVLVTLLLGNVITNETLPIVLDRSLGGGWPAVLGSTVLIVIFGEIIPQSICVRYGLPIGAWMSPLVLVLMYVLAPVAWPTAKLLDRILGEDHGTTYKKAGLKTLVTLHKSLGADGEQLNQDEVTIISAVLDLKAKPVGNIMTPMDHVFTMSADTVLDEKTMELILGAGYSRIPIYAPDNDQNYVGMLLVKILITYDPEDCKRVREFALATLPETRPETSCLDIINFFQEGKSHMVLVSEDPGKDHGAVGVVTLEDVIEELIGEEIIDESDVYVDVHKAMRRGNPAPKLKVPKGEVVTDIDDSLADGNEALIEIDNDKDPREALQSQHTADDHDAKPNTTSAELATSPNARGDLFRRKSSSFQAPSEHEGIQRKPPMSAEMRKRFEHIGPSNLASRPKTTRLNTVKIKPAQGSSNTDEPNAKPSDASTTPRGSLAAHGGVGAGLVNSAGKDAKDGVLAVQAGYGSIPTSASPTSPKPPKKDRLARPTDNHHQRPSAHSRTDSQSTLGSMHSGRKSPVSRSRSHRGTARSGSITENIIHAGGFKKTVLEMTSSSEDPEGSNGANGKNGGGKSDGDEGGKENERRDGASGGKKKRRRRKRKDGGEDEPLLGDR